MAQSTPIKTTSRGNCLFCTREINGDIALLMDSARIKEYIKTLMNTDKPGLALLFLQSQIQSQLSGKTHSADSETNRVFGNLSRRQFHLICSRCGDTLKLSIEDKKSARVQVLQKRWWEFWK
jgi:hypothetical protein